MTASRKTSTSAKAVDDKPADDKDTKAHATGEKSRSDDSGPSYSEQAASLGTDARDLGERLIGEMRDLVQRVDDMQAEAVSTPADSAAVEGMRQLPMAADDVTRALRGLITAAANLQRTAG